MTFTRKRNGARARDAAIVKIFVSASPSRAENKLAAPSCPYPLCLPHGSWSRKEVAS
jgi:hypothetical protein